VAEAPPQERPLPYAGCRLILALAWIPALGFAVLAFATRVDVPVLDDFDAILRFLLRLEQSEGVAWLARFLDPHVDHRIVLTRALAWGQVAIAGRVDFAWLSLCGSGLAAGMFVLLVWRRPSHATQAGALGLVTASLLWFQPQAYDMLHWPTASIASYAVFAFAAAAFVCVGRETPKALAGSWLCCAAATLCQGNGSILWPSVIVVLLVRGRRREAAGFALASLPPVMLYAATYRGHSDGAAQLLDPSRWSEIALHGLQLLGAVAGPLGSVAALALGGVLVAGLLASWFVGGLRLDVRVLGMGLVALGTVGGNAVLRSGLGAEYALSQPRYRVSSVLLLLVLQLGLADLLRGRRGERPIQLAVFAAALGFCMLSYLAYAPAVEVRSQSVARGIARWQLTGEGLSHSEPERAGELLRRAEARGLYRVRPRALEGLLDGPVAVTIPASPTGGLRGRITRVVADADFVLVEGSVAREGSTPGRAVFVVLEGGPAPTAISTRSQDFEGPAGQGHTGFRSVFARPPAHAGDAIGLLAVHEERSALARTSRALSRAASASGH
jgi:hypothetical protein